MPLYRPRMALKLSVPIEDTARNGGTDEIETYFVPIRRLSLELNDHAHADTAEVVCDWKMTGADPRLLANAIGVVYLGNADENGFWEPTDSDVRFAGIMRRPRRSGNGTDGLSASLLFHDYTAFFLEAKIFPSDGIPDYSDTLADAWRRICDHTGYVDPTSGELRSSVQFLRNRIRFDGAADTRIGSAVAERFAKFSKVHVPPKADAWAVWQQCVGMLGLISFMRLDECIVTTATDYYTANDPPRLVWGHDVLNFSDERDLTKAGQGIIITSFDPLTSTTLEAFYPPVGSTSILRKRLHAAKANTDQVTQGKKTPKQKKPPKPPSVDAVRAAESREAFAVPGVTDQNTLDDIARRVYEERSRQEFEGRLTTCEMSLERVSGDQFDLLQIQAGDSIRFEMDRNDLESVGGLNSDEDRVDYLVGLGYAPGVARTIVRNIDSILSLPPVFLVKSARIRCATEADSGTFEVELAFINKIQVGGEAA